MILLHNIGPKPSGPAAGNYNPREQIEQAIEKDLHLSFDGIYLNVWENRDILLKCKKKPILFVMGGYVGGDNSFDRPMPFEKYCDWNQIMDLVINFNCELGWHTWTHQQLINQTDDQVRYELKPPFPMKYFAYPYGNLDFRIETMVRSAGYEEAFSVFQGHGGRMARKREYL